MAHQDAQAPDVEAALAALAAVKAEHRPILSMISADPGMSPATRRALIEHLYDEEDEHVAKISAMLGGAGAPSAGGPGAGAQAKGLSVGSLRAEPPTPAGPSVGSLRHG